MITIDFQYGTLVVRGDKTALDSVSQYLKYDPRVDCFRTRADKYAPVVQELHSRKIPYTDKARQYNTLDLRVSGPMAPRCHQKDALRAWIERQCRGVVVLPTGSGKSYLAMLAMEHVKRSTLVVVPTIDLLQQWAGQLERTFQAKVGMLGGGSKEILDITVSTYDSAVLAMEYMGNRFGLVIFDECHHLPGPTNRLASTMCLAPYRLGLTATPERQDGGEETLYGLLGSLCYRRDIDEMKAKILAPYEVTRVELDLDEDEAEEYERNRGIYLNFVRSNNVSFGSANGWSRFVGLCYRSQEGKEAFEAYCIQKRVTQKSRAKFRKIWELLTLHASEKSIIFTADNSTAYEIGRKYFLPVMTHHTKAAERKEFLDAFRAGTYPVLVTSRVLNEGIDVPEASVGIIVSGSGSIREHVQRLGRILRPAEGKQARLYELVSKGTAEFNTSERRRQHSAYQRTP